MLTPRRPRPRHCATQFETQKLHATRKAAVGPNALLDIGLDAAAAEQRQPCRVREDDARHSAPPIVITQPMSAFGPSGARLTGSRKMPEPMIVPTTSALVIQRPSCRLRRSLVRHHAPPGLGSSRRSAPSRARAKPDRRSQCAHSFFRGRAARRSAWARRWPRRAAPRATCSSEVDEALGQNLFRLMRDGPEDELKLTENAQPAIMANALAVFARADPRRRRRAGARRRSSSPATASANIRRCARRGRSTCATTAKLLKLRGQAMQAAVPVGVGRDGGAARRRPRAGAADRRRRGRRAKSAPSPTTMTRARSCCRATRARSTARSRWPRRWAPSARCCCRCRRRSTAR